MIKKLFIFPLVAVLLVSCYDDSKIWETLNDHEERITLLEVQCKRMNANILSLQSILESLQNGEYITNVSTVVEGGIEMGYTLAFSSGKTVTIYHGKSGKDGADGKDG